MTSCHPASETVLQHSFPSPAVRYPCSTTLVLTLFCALLHDIKPPMKHTFILGREKELQRKTEWESEVAAAVWKQIFQVQHRWASGMRYSKEVVLHLTPPVGFMTNTAWVHLQDKNHLGTGSSSKAGTRRRKGHVSAELESVKKKMYWKLLS